MTVYGGRRARRTTQSSTQRTGFINPPMTPMANAPFASFYKSKEWRAFRAQIIRERGEVCQDKEHEEGKPMINIDLDHVRELQDGGEPLSRGNVLLRCRSCHKRKTAFEMKTRHEREFWERQARLTGG